MVNFKPDDKGWYLLKKLQEIGKMKGENTIVVTKPKIEAKALMKDNDISEIQVKADKEGMALVNKIVGEIDYVGEKDVKYTGIELTDLKSEENDKLFYDRKEFIKRKNALGELLGRIDMNQKLPNGFIFDVLTLQINPEIKIILGDERKTNFSHKFMASKEYFLTTKDTDNDIDIKTEGKLMGRYFRNRNTIVIFANVWKNTNELIKFLKVEIKKLNVKVEDTEKFKLIGLAKIFTKDIEKRVKEKERTAKDNRANIKSLQDSIFEKFQRLEMDNVEVETLKSMKKNFKGNFFSEMAKVKKLSIVEDIQLSPTEINITYKPTCITDTSFTRSKNFGKRSMYIGSVILKITGAGIMVDNKEKMCLYTNGDPTKGVEAKYPHPHAHDKGDVCWGLEATKDLIYSLRSQCKIADLAIYLWRFVKEYGHDGGYFKPYNLYDYNLMNNLPIFDGKGERILLNDPERIKTGEQIKLKEAKDFVKNGEKFRNFNLA